MPELDKIKLYSIIQIPIDYNTMTVIPRIDRGIQIKAYRLDCPIKPVQAPHSWIKFRTGKCGVNSGRDLQ